MSNHRDRSQPSDEELFKKLRHGGLVPPNDLDAEAAVLSAAMLDPEAFDEVAETLRGEHFYADVNRWVWEAIVALREQGQPADLVTVASRLKGSGRLDAVGGTPYLHQLANATPAYAHIGPHAMLVREKARLRKFILQTQRASIEAYGCDDVQALLDEHEQAVYELSREERGSEVHHIGGAAQSALQNAMTAKDSGGISGVETGAVELDKMMSGLGRGDLTIVAARPGMGKSAYVLGRAVHVAMPKSDDVPGLGVAFFSLEMPKEQLAARLLSSESRVDLKRFRTGNYDANDWKKLTDTAALIGTLPIWIDDTSALNLTQLRAKVRKIEAACRRGEHGGEPSKLGLVAIDYLQLMQGRKGATNREQEISEISRGLKQLAKEMGVPVMALSQLNRSVETRSTKDKRPQLSDLRESGAIEQDADNIIFIYRDEYYFRDSPDKGVAELILAKQRNGPTGTVRMKYTQEYTRFDNLADDDYDFDEYDRHSGGGNYDDYGDHVSP